jgi:hypothetical protein
MADLNRSEEIIPAWPSHAQGRWSHPRVALPLPRRVASRSWECRPTTSKMVPPFPAGGSANGWLHENRLAPASGSNEHGQVLDAPGAAQVEALAVADAEVVLDPASVHGSDHPSAVMMATYRA